MTTQDELYRALADNDGQSVAAKEVFELPGSTVYRLETHEKPARPAHNQHIHRHCADTETEPGGHPQHTGEQP